ncbi:MAG: 3-phosphoshikimate 1-carboxyvinyltransferase [Rhodospirillales bacterium]|nr:MAG: 3-phosphoshikimate 1-carboxyvinyltransferase [Rhodospirillales bacterium]
MRDRSLRRPKGVATRRPHGPRPLQRLSLIALSTPNDISIVPALASHPAAGLNGRITVPGDKSISHRALILGASAVGETRIHGLLEAEDVLATANALRALGATIVHDDDGTWRVQGAGVGGLAEPAQVLDLGNSGTGVRLLMGLAATHPFSTFFTGDRSLCRRPMRRVAEPLERMGASLVARSGCRLPLCVIGTPDPLPIEYTLPVASAQVKSAILLAALNTPGEITVIEPVATRDHTERMLAAFGAGVSVEPRADGGRAIRLTGQPELAATDIAVPGDISSAAFPLVAALITTGSRLVIEGVGVNPLRTGLLDALTAMGANLVIADRRHAGGEPVADLIAEAGPLTATAVTAAAVPSMIDEIPILAVAAACANGATRIDGLGELRVKESDRLSAVARGLAACGVVVEEGEDWLVVHGTGGPPAGGAVVPTDLDHRIAMAFLVLGTAGRAAVGIDDDAAIATSFPGFAALMGSIGADLRRS